MSCEARWRPLLQYACTNYAVRSVNRAAVAVSIVLKRLWAETSNLARLKLRPGETANRNQGTDVSRRFLFCSCGKQLAEEEGTWVEVPP